MKRNSWLLAISAFLVLGVLAACQNPLTQGKTILEPTGPALVSPQASSGLPSGIVSVRVNPVAPVLGKYLAAAAAANTKPTGRAFLTAFKLHFTLLDGSTGTNTIDSWDQELTATSTIFDGFAQSGNNFGFPAGNRVIPVGQYNLKVDVYNPNDLTTPVVSGGTKTLAGAWTPFSVNSGQSTPVSITCFPVNPTVLTKEVSSPMVSLPTPWNVSNLSGAGGAPVVNTAGSEKWYKVTIPQNSSLVQFAAIPEAGSFAALGLFLYDTAGGFRDAAGSMDPATGDLLPGAPAAFSYDATYDTSMGPVDVYLGVMDFGIGTALTRNFRILVSNSPPDNFRVSGQNTNEVDLAWDGAPGASGYVLYRASNLNGTYSQIATLTPGSTLFNDYGASQSLNYYKISANYNSGPSSPLSSAISAVGLPQAPAQAPTSVNFYNWSTTSIDLSWNSVPNTTWYTIYVYSDPAATMLVTLNNYISSNYATVAGLDSGTGYYFKIQAVNAQGSGPMSGIFYSSTASPQPPPVPSPWVTNATLNSLDINWNYDASVAYYEVYRDDSQYDSFSTFIGYGYGSMYTDSGLPSGTTYYYRVRAFNSAGLFSDLSAWASGTTLAALLWPANFSIDGTASTADSIKVTWSPYVGASDYTVYWYLSTGGSGQMNLVGLNNTSYVITGITPNVNYSIWVMANNSNWSNNISYERVQFAGTSSMVVTNFYQPYYSGNFYVRWSDSYSGNLTATVDVALQMKDPYGNLLFGSEGSTWDVDSG